MNNFRGKTLISLAAIVMLLFSFGLGALSSYVLAGPRAGAILPATAPALAPAPTDTAPSLAANTATAVPAAQATTTVPADLNAQMKDFYEVLSLLQQESYYRPLDTQKLIYGATQGMMSVVGDDYTRFEQPDAAAVTQGQLQGESFGGVGMTVEIVDNLPTVVSPIPDTPAAKAGIRARDAILKVDGRDVTKLSLDQVVALIRGPAGSTVRLTLGRVGQPAFDVDVVRAIINVPQVTTEIRPDGIAVFTATSFGEKTTAQLDAGIRQVHAAQVKGIVLDLRNNPGGLVNVAQEMLGRFISPTLGQKYNDTALYYSKARDGSDDEAVPITRNGEQLYDLPLVVLINGGSASASEIVAEALSDYGRATLIGEQSFGKGSVQNVHPLSDGSSARITIAHWLSPGKHDINPKPTATAVPSATPTPLPTLTPTPQGGIPTPVPGITPTAVEPAPRLDRGITPDLVVPRTTDDFAHGRDPQLDRAVQFLLTRK